MDQESKKLIGEKLDKLPANLRTFIANLSWKQSVAKVGGQFNLKPEQITKLENEVFLTLLCFEPPSDLKENIKTELGLDENAGRRIADSLNGAVLGRVMGDIKNAWKPDTSLELKAKSLEGNTSEELRAESLEGNVKENSSLELRAESLEGKPEQEAPSSKLQALSLAISYEDMAKAMQPAVPKMEAPKVEPPVNLPVKGYEGSKDPYREPLE